MKNKKSLWALVLSVAETAWLGFIFSNSLKSKSVSAEQSKPFEDMIKPSLDAIGTDKNTAELAAVIARKSAHVAEFFVLTIIAVGILYLLGKKPKAVAWVAGAFGFICACTDEALQLISLRGAAIKDVLIDSVGVLLAVAVFGAFIKIKNKKNKAKS